MGMSTWNDGVISARNKWAAELGVQIGMSCQEAAKILITRQLNEVPAGETVE